MKIKLNTAKLSDVMVSFYEINGIRIVIFDADYNEILAYPAQKCSFCRAVRENPDLCAKCRQSDFNGFAECRKKDDICIYKCHAGLVEAVMPIKNNDLVIGYMMFGQITDIKDKNRLSKIVGDMIEKYNLGCDISGIKFKSKRQIITAAKILEICTDYILLKEMIELENDKLISAAKEYIKANISNDIGVDDICMHCGCGRTKLYEIFKANCNMGIAHYINEERLLAARQLLKTTDLTVGEVSEKCGFNDYNYFSRVYKKKFGNSPRKDAHI